MKKLLVITATLTIAAFCSTQAADAKAIWDKDCAKCHAKDGTGNTKMGKKLDVKDYTNAKVQAEMKDDAAFKAIKEGVKKKGTDTVLMKPTEGVTDEEIKALIAYIRKFKK
ncbi:MAG: cytochrome c [Verrucomicrobia bacterium]|nr:cytochrome c [Verrucomicrobiota bacterium]